jgi:HAD superfamily hydrolase (TIGR01509 family)
VVGILAAVLPALQLVIFDCDGVLVDSETISNRVLAEMLSNEGLPTTLAQSRREYQGMLLADIRTRAEEQLGRSLAEDWLARYETQRDTAFNRELEPVAGAIETVGHITATGIPVCVASQGKLTKIALSLGLTGLDHFFPETARFSSYSVARGKPAPDVFLHAASTMRAEPPDCVVVEDTPSGITAAVSAGMCALGLAADSDEHALREAGATEILRSLDELPGLLGLEPL